MLTDFSCASFDAADVAATAGILESSCDAVLVGEHQNRPDFPPTLMGRLLLDCGMSPWITLSCRDRNRVVLEQELRGLLSIGVHTVFCVTGDGRGYDVRPDVTQTFDLDGPRLVSLAASVGAIPAVPETPTAPPVSARPARLVEKQRAGAGIAVLNHVPFPETVADFVARARAIGLTIPVIAAVAAFTDVGVGSRTAGPAWTRTRPGSRRRGARRSRPGRGGYRGRRCGGAGSVVDRWSGRRERLGARFVLGHPPRCGNQGRDRTSNPCRGGALSEAMDAEFDTIADWTAQVAVSLGPDYFIPAACRGSGSPAALDWLVERMGLAPGDSLLDSGAGIGGPAAYAAKAASVTPLLVEPEVGACRAARKLFGHSVIRGSGSALPFSDASFDAGWSLGVLCTTPDQLALLAELRRTVRPHGRIGLLVFIARNLTSDEQPEGNSFPSSDKLIELVDAAGLAVEDWQPTADLPAIPSDWTARVDAVTAALTERYRHTRAWQLAERQGRRISSLLEERKVTGEMLVLRRCRPS